MRSFAIPLEVVVVGNPNWVKGGASPNPSGRTSREKLAARSLALACQAAASDEEIAEWLLVIASGRWPDIRPASGKGKDGTPELMTMPPDGAQRLAALKEFLLRRDGQPMQAVYLKADLEARARIVNNANDAIAIDDIDPAAAGALEQVLAKALGAGVNPDDAIDAESTERPLEVPA